MAAGQFCLRWNNHQPNFVSVFSSLLQDDQLVDVTLIAENNQIQAHKVVLSACSEYFKTLFLRNPCTHPIIILTDVKYVYLTNLVEFMYTGETNIHQEQLADLLRIAEQFKVKGLEEIPSFDFSTSDFDGLPARTDQVTNEVNNETVESLSEMDVRTSVDTDNNEAFVAQEENGEPEAMDVKPSVESSLDTAPIEKFNEDIKVSMSGGSINLSGSHGHLLLAAQPVVRLHRLPEVENVIDSIKNGNNLLVPQTLRNFRRIRQIKPDSKTKQPPNDNGTCDMVSVPTLPTGSPPIISTETTINHVNLSQLTANGNIIKFDQPMVTANGKNELMNFKSGSQLPNTSYGKLSFKSDDCDKSATKVDSTEVDTSKKRQKTNSDALQKAIEAVRFDGMGFCKAARIHGVNNRTLWLQYHKLGYPATTGRSRRKFIKPTANPQ